MKVQRNSLTTCDSVGVWAINIVAYHKDPAYGNTGCELDENGTS
jgi:hypothetical protein